VGQWTRWLLSWIPLRHGGNEPAIQARWKEVAGQEADANVRTLLASLTLTYAELTNSLEAWQRNLEDWNVQKSTYLEGFREEGRREARREATLEARREDLLMLLEKRFGPLPAEVVQHIRAATDPEQVKTWLGRVLDLHAPTDLLR
jgi:hypothetical protein